MVRCDPRQFRTATDSEERFPTIPPVSEYVDEPIKKSSAGFDIGLATITIVCVGVLFAIYLPPRLNQLSLAGFLDTLIAALAS